MSNHKAVAQKAAKRRKTRSLLLTLVDQYGYAGVAKKLGYSYAYTHEMANDKKPITAKAAKRISAACRRSKSKTATKRVVTTFPDLEEGEAMARLSMERRQSGLRWERLIGEELPGFLARRG